MLDYVQYPPHGSIKPFEAVHIVDTAHCVIVANGYHTVVNQPASPARAIVF